MVMIILRKNKSFLVTDKIYIFVGNYVWNIQVELYIPIRKVI